MQAIACTRCRRFAGLVDSQGEDTANVSRAIVPSSAAYAQLGVVRTQMLASQTHLYVLSQHAVLCLGMQLQGFEARLCCKDLRLGL